MKFRRVGDSGLIVSQLCLGTMTFGGGGDYWSIIGDIGDGLADRFIGTAFDAGVNFIDTANVYADGESERLLGRALRRLARQRDTIVVGTKVCARMGNAPNQGGLSRLHILKSIDDSLARLQLEHVDLLQIHGFDPLTPLEETLRALDDLVRSGKVRYLGWSNLPAWMAMRALACQQAHHWTRFISGQVYYSLAGRDIEREIVPLAADQKLGILVWSPLAGGLLAEKPGGPDSSLVGPVPRRARLNFPPVDPARAEACLMALRVIAQQREVPVARAALAWVLAQPHVTSVLIGARTEEQLLDNLASSELVLSPEELATLDSVSSLPAEYPAWMVAWQNRHPRL